MLTFNSKYFILTTLLFIVEILIALFVNDQFVRPYLGDVLVVILVYAFLKSFLKLSILNLAVFTLLFSFFVEGMQFINLVKKLGWEQYKLARVVIGNSFSWLDILCYAVGVAAVLVIEKYILKKDIRAAS